jgi:hypothetical protein
MLLRDNDRKLIQDYLDGSLSKEDKELFDLKMKEKNFSEAVVFYNAVVGGIEDFHREELKNELKQSLVNENAKTKKHRSVREYWPLAAAVVIIVAVGFLYMFLHSGTGAAEKLFLSYYKPFPIKVTTRGKLVTYESAGFEKYSSHDYKDAAILFEELISHNDSTVSKPLVYLLLGNSYLNTGDVDKAMASFNLVMRSGDGIMAQHGKWYYALALIKTNKSKEALKVLNEITTAKSIYSKPAEEIMNKLQHKN